MPQNPGDDERDDKVVQDTVLFSNLLKEMTTFTRGLLDSPMKIASAEHLGRMTWCFTAKMVYHSRSILALTEEGCERDAGMIARSMIEGHGLYAWSVKDADTMPELWGAFGWVESYRDLAKSLAAGRHHAEGETASILAAIEHFGDRFPRKNQSMPSTPFAPGSGECFRKYWFPPKRNDEWRDDESVKALAAHFYSSYSAWIQWTSRGLSGMFQEDGNIVAVTPKPGEAVSAITVACRCLKGMTEALISHFDLGCSQELEDLIERCAGPRLRAEASRMEADGRLDETV